MTELSAQQIRRLDFVHNEVHGLLCRLAGRSIPWNMEVIGEISDIAEEHICARLELMRPVEFAPYVEVEDAE